MRKTTCCFLIACTLFAAISGCKKIKNAIQRLPLADTLRAACTAPFIGHGDSSDVYFPTAFTPNGDGLNDVYRPLMKYNGGQYFSSFSLKVYDTTANLVYESNDATMPWDGIDRTTHVQSTKYKFYVKITYTTASRNITDSGSTYLYLLSGTTCISRVPTDTAKYQFPSQFDFTTGYNSTWSSYEHYCD